MNRRHAVTVALCWGLLCLALAFVEWASLSMVGFPDGHLTVFDRETVSPRRVLLVLCVAQALIIPTLALAGRLRRGAALALAIVAAGLLVVAPMVALPGCPGSPACRAAYEALTGRVLDHGIGG
ncbi:hypothetical protein [Phreatobacter cathodiphilus]|uniref:Uncharacterized protein n=1 Tax=Phreatobacter cathodiphilus TaxID=1868589 RepID=A0A2S0NH72_9HYPH|nr:hypothetical protein [Phreatobacter cathodiphilus]AVO47366.1 hypothetical protein C6569_21260 [Phreatobacter cathodiphilus]